MDNDRQLSASPRGVRSPRASTANSSWDAPVGMARDLTVVRETYSTARQVYAQLLARPSAAEGRECRRFFMAGYSVLIAVRTALQKKRYQKVIAKQRATVEELFFQELRDLGSDAASDDSVKSGITGCLKGVYEMLQSSTDREIDLRLEVLVEDITKACGASFDKAYELSQSLRCSLDELMIMRSQMDALPVQSTLAQMQDLLGTLAPPEFTEKVPSIESPRPRRKSLVHLQRALAGQETSAAQEEQWNVAGEELSRSAQLRLTIQERRLAMIERRSNLERVRSDQVASAWLHRAQEALEATETLKSTMESQASTNQATQPPNCAAVTYHEDPPEGKNTSRLLQRRMKKSKTFCGDAGVQELDTPGWRDVAQNDLLSLYCSTDCPDGRQDHDARHHHDLHDPHLTSGPNSPYSQAVPEELEISTRSDDDQSCDDLVESVNLRSKAQQRFGLPRLLTDARASRSAKSSRSPHGGRSTAGGSHDPWDESGSPSGRCSAAPPMTLQRRNSRNHVAIEVPELAAGASGMPALKTPSIHRHSVRLASSRRAKTAEELVLQLEKDEIAEGAQQTSQLVLHQEPSRRLATDTPLQTITPQADPSRWAMRGRMRSKDVSTDDAFAAANQPMLMPQIVRLQQPTPPTSPQCRAPRPRRVLIH